MVDVKEIESILNGMSCIAKVVNTSRDTSLCVSIEVNLPELSSPLPFSVIFAPWYPSKACGEESIHFINDALMDYPHIMEGGRLCLHTISSADLREKLTSDIRQLCEWIHKYYIEKKTDNHFDHLVVNESLVNDCYYSFNYAQISSSSSLGDSGYVYYKPLLDGIKKGKTIKNFIVASFQSKWNNKEKPSHISPFSDFYVSSDNCLQAPYIVIKDIPGEYKKFLFKNYNRFENLISQVQRKHIHEYLNRVKWSKQAIPYFPLFIGYHIPNGEIAWNVAIIDTSAPPTTGIPYYKNSHKTGIWLSSFNNQPIDWAMCNDISPVNFFGRGALPSAITNKRILIMGIGAIGSIVAHTLVRGGCKEIGLYDFDIKQPGNVCRSEYDFICPTNDKTIDLANQLRRISPYVNVSIYIERFDEYVKLASQQSEEIKNLIRASFQDHYDLIIDCTTDDDVMYALEQLSLPIDVINLSISNHANELVCAFSPSIYEFVRGVYSHTIKQDPYDVFFPIGCWNPTFKASFNDIEVKLQYALKRALRMLTGNENKRNFIISENDNGLIFRPW